MLEDLVSVALVGTQKIKGEIPQSSSESLNTLLSQLNTHDGENNLLKAASILALYQRAGKVPSKLERPLPEPCSLDDLPVCSSTLSKLFLFAFTTENTKVLGEFLDLFSKTSQRIPEERLCQLLDYGSNHTELREAISKVIGNRGKWLAEQNPSWHYAKTVSSNNVSSEEIWQTGNKLARIILLKELRKTDDKKARELVLSTWKEEPAEYRFAFISTFKENLSLEDESFLEMALDDKAKDVRKEAQNLLCCLSESKFHTRMLERLRLIATMKIDKKKLVLEINLPDSLDEETKKDIAEVIAPNKAIGQKAWWLRSIIKAVHPKFWTNEFKLSYEEILLIIVKSEWKNDILPALSVAISNHLDLDWARFFFKWCVEKKLTLDLAVAEKVFSKFSPSQQEELLKMLLREDEKFHPTNLTGTLLHFHKTMWSKDLLKQVLDKALEVIKNNKKVDWGYIYLLEHIALYTPRVVILEVLSLFDEENFYPTQWRAWESALENTISLLQFRRKMFKEFIK